MSCKIEKISVNLHANFYNKVIELKIKQIKHKWL